MSGQTSPAQVTVHSFYGESPPKRSRVHDDSTIRPLFKSLKDNLIKFEKKVAEPIKGSDLKDPDLQEIGEEPRSLDRDSPLPLKNLGNTCYENSIIQCLFSLDMFMDNFERSMVKMRQFVVKPEIKTFDVLPASDQSNKAGTNDGAKATIAEDDVRYRIANAFDKLYKSYTKKRIQIENSTPNKHQPTQTAANNQVEPIEITHFKTYSAISPPNKAISLCNSQAEGQQSTEKSSDDNPKETTEVPESTTTTTDNVMSSNLTPIALVSSSAANLNEQSEIETRLEDLKSAVGERSSQFNSAHQQDASEFFYHVIDSIQEFYQSLNKTNDDDNPVTKAFEFELDYMIRCPKCHHRTMSEPEKIRTLPLALPHVNDESSTINQDSYRNGAPTPPTSDLGLDSPESNSGSDEKENQALSHTEKVVPDEGSATNAVSNVRLDLNDKVEQKQHTLVDALNNYFKDDLLEYKCSQAGCDSKQRTKKCLIRKLPQILFITLARYSYAGKKNLDEIKAPFELSVPFRENKSPSHSPTTHRSYDDDDLYQLVAVVCHLGSSLNAGHYTSYVFNQTNSSWYSCDDDSITKVQESDVERDVSKTGYCFFYAHKSCMDPKPQQTTLRLQTIASVEKPKESEANVVIDKLANSSVILTPESSPKLSPSNDSQESVEMQDCHSECLNGTNIIDDWS